MAIGRIDSESGLRQIIREEILNAPSRPVEIPGFGHPPTDEDFPGTPHDGALAFDESGPNPTLYRRVGGEWKEVT